MERAGEGRGGRRGCVLYMGRLFIILDGFIDRMMNGDGWIIKIINKLRSDPINNNHT